MYKTLIKHISILTLPLIVLWSDFAYSHKELDTKNEANNESYKVENNPKSYFDDNEIAASSQNTVDYNLMKSFDDYPSFEESIGSGNQFKNLFGSKDKELKKSAFKLWKAYEKEMSKQIGIERLNGPDINNTFNESLNSLSR